MSPWANLAVLYALAAGMSVFGALVLYLASKAERRFDRALVVFLVAMMISMALGGVLYELLPPVVGIEVALFEAMWVMVIGLGYLLSQLLAEEASPEPSFWRDPWFLVVVIGGTLLTESMVGYALALASGLIPALRVLPLLPRIALLLTSGWFLLPMALEMALSFLLLRKSVPRFAAAILALQPAVMVFSPTLLSSPLGQTILVVTGGSVMTALFILIMEYFTRQRTLELGTLRYILAILVVYSGMMAGVFLWVYASDPDLLAAAIVAEMVLFFDAVLRPARFRTKATYRWDKGALVAFSLIFLIFVSEFFMGAAFDLALFGPGQFLSALPTIPGGTPLLTRVGYEFVIGLFFVTLVLGSVWFLVMMGFEMGALVLFKMRATRNRETRVRLGFVVGAFAIYTVLLPDFLLTGSISRYPMIGWSMGLGSGGGITPALLPILLATYLISGVLSLLFGARQLCSGLCSAALMYQGSFYDSLKVYHLQSPGGRKLRGSRLTALYGLVFSLSWASVTAAAVLSYLNYAGTIHLTVFGDDVAYFTEVFYFNFLWYLLFVSIPFLGTYACVTSGYCYWGTFNQMLGRLGFFRLKVRDPATCVRCPDKPCTHACPVGLSDLPAHFIRKGEFRAMKCIGVGDCVESCPYDNILFWDVRHWLKGRGVGHGAATSILARGTGASHPEGPALRTAFSDPSHRSTEPKGTTRATPR